MQQTKALWVNKELEREKESEKETLNFYSRLKRVVKYRHDLAKHVINEILFREANIDSQNQSVHTCSAPRPLAMSVYVISF